MRISMSLLGAILITLTTIACGANGEPNGTVVGTMAPTPTPVIINTPTPHVVPVATDLPTATVTPQPSPALTPVPPTPKPTDTQAPSPTSTASPTPTSMPTPTPTLVPTLTPVPMPTSTIIPTSTPMPTSTPVPEPTLEPTAVSTPLPTLTPTPQPIASEGNGDWIYFGPECPDAYDNCAFYSSEHVFMSLEAYSDTNESFYDEAGVRISCWRGSPSLVFDGGGPWIGGTGRTGLNVRFASAKPEEGTHFRTDDNDFEYVEFDRTESAGIIAFIEDAERQRKDVTFGAVGDYDTVVADFDVTGFTTNYQRLPCS